MTMKPKAHAVPVPVSTEEALPGATYRDAFALRLPERLDAREAARRALGTTPGWVKGLMAMRNALVAPFGLKSEPKPADTKRMGFFPVLSESADRMVLGLDDKHLDFRIVVDTEVEADGTLVTATTLVKTHNIFGRAYLATIMPFHRAIVPVMLNQAKKSDRGAQGDARSPAVG